MSCGSVGQTRLLLHAREAPAIGGSQDAKSSVCQLCRWVCGKGKVESLLLSSWFSLPRPVASTQSAAKRNEIPEYH